jgi:hypothetical protein
MLLILIVALLAGCTMAGAWYGRLQERAWWTRRLLERGINPNTLHPRGSGMPLGEVEPLTPLDPDADAMRDTMEDMAREVERLVEGQRFLTKVLTERRQAGGSEGGSSPARPLDVPRPPVPGPGDERDR